MIRPILFLIFIFVCHLFLSPGIILAQSDVDPDEEFEILDEIEDISDNQYLHQEAFPVLDRAVNVMTGRTIRKNAILIVIDHRLRESLTENSFHNLLGFDAGGLKVGLGLRYGLFDNWDVGVYRINGTTEIFDTYEFDFRHQLLSQTSSPIDLAVRAGASLFTQADFEDGSGFFGQLLFNHLVNNRINLGSGLLYHSNSSNSEKSNTDQHHSLAIPAYLEIRLKPSMVWNVEIVANISGYKSSRAVFSTAWKFITHRHSFALLLSNTQYISADGIVTNSHTGLNDLIIGFYITREIQL